jgi:hypothetical protein
MPKDDDNYVPKPYSCRCGAILGEIYREKNKRVTQLRIYRHTRTQSMGLADKKLLPEKYIFAGNAIVGKVFCEHCGADNDWNASQAALDEMLSKMHKRSFGLEVEHG